MRRLKGGRTKNFFDTVKPVLFLVILPSIAILLLVSFTQGSPQQSDPTEPFNTVGISKSSIRLDKTNYNFGKISQKDGLVETLYTVTNTGAEDIFLKELYTSCGCTKAQLIYADGSVSGLYTMKGHANPSDFYVAKSIKPGETVKIKAIFDPNAHGPQGIGYIKRNIMLNTNLKEKSLIQFSFEAEVTR